MLGDAVEIRVRDNGTGIPPDIRDKLFQPFFTTKPTGEGTGLGLSITYDIVTKQHGGTIAVDSEVGGSPNSSSRCQDRWPRGRDPCPAGKRVEAISNRISGRRMFRASSFRSRAECPATAKPARSRTG